MRKRGHAKQSAAASVVGFAVRAGVVIRHAAVVVMVNGAVRMGMRQALMLRWRAHSAQLIKAVERCRASGDRGRRRQDAKSIGQRDQNRRPDTEVFRQTTHRGLGTDFQEFYLYTIRPVIFQPNRAESWRDSRILRANAIVFAGSRSAGDWWVKCGIGDLPQSGQRPAANRLTCEPLLDLPSESSSCHSANTVDFQFDRLGHLCWRRKLQNPLAMMPTWWITLPSDWYVAAATSVY